jgi:adenine-specific DNA-methyltransferase
MDEIFVREKSYLNMITMTTNDPSGFKATSSSLFSTANYILVYAKNRSASKINKVFIEKEYDTAYSKIIVNKEAPYQDWKFENISDTVAKKNGYKSAFDAKKRLGAQEFKQKIGEYAIENADIVFRTAAIGGGAKIKRHITIEDSKNNRNRVFVHPNEDVEGFYILNGEQILFYSNRLSIINGEKKPVQAITDVWTDISWTGIAPEGEVQFKNGKKPEKLIQRVFDITTNPGDLVLDSFLGSGTTAAVAHKMGRRYIGIEMGEQAKTHCVARLKKVIDGEQGGISEAVNWKGGGGFRFFKLGEAVFDSEGRIESDISFENLAAHIYFSETKTPMKKSKKKSAFLGIHDDTAYALLYNGILGDKSIDGGNVLTRNTLNHIINEIDAASKKKDEVLSYSTLVIYGEATRLTDVSLKSKNIIFKQTPYDIKVW